jgi:polysaccharide biosynthesis protein PslJ
MWVPSTRPSGRSLAVGAAVVAIAVALLVLVAIGGFRSDSPGLFDDAMGAIIDFAPLGLLIALSFPILVAVATRPQLGVLLIALLVPWDGLLAIIKTPDFTEGYKEGLTLYVLLWAIFNYFGNKDRVRQPRPRYFAPLVFYVAVGLVSAARIGGIDALVGLKTSFFYLLIPIALWWCPFNRKERDLLISIIMLNGFLTSLYGIYQQIVGDERLLSWGYEYGTHIRTTGQWLRSFSSFAQHSAFGLFLMMVLLVCVPVALDELPRLRSKLFLASTPILLLALAYTFVRSAWLGLAFGALYLAFKRYRVLLFFAPFALPMIILLPGTFEKGAFYRGSFEERQVGWTENLNRAADPFGNGIGTTGAAAEKALEVASQDTAVYQPDNNYFKVLYELGVVGLFFFVMVLIACFLYTRDVEKRVRGPDLALVIGTGANILAVMVAAVTAVYFEIFPDDLFFWLLMGTVASCVRQVQGQDETQDDAVELSSTPSR